MARSVVLLDHLIGNPEERVASEYTIYAGGPKQPSSFAAT